MMSQKSVDSSSYGAGGGFGVGFLMTSLSLFGAAAGWLPELLGGGGLACAGVGVDTDVDEEWAIDEAVGFDDGVPVGRPDGRGLRTLSPPLGRGFRAGLA